MTTREDLLATIAAAQAQLAGLDVVPKEDPGGDVERYFRLVARHGTGSHHYTYLWLRVPSSVHDAFWYPTGLRDIKDGDGRMLWHHLQMFISRLTVISWDELVVEDATTVAQATELIDEINVARDVLASAGYPGVTLYDQVRHVRPSAREARGE